MVDKDQNQTEPVKMFRPWVGVVLSLFIVGASQFLSGKKRNGVAWFFGLLLLRISCVWCLASPFVPGDMPAVILLAFFVGLWITMLIKSYRPVPRFRLVGWIFFVVLALIISEVVFRGVRTVLRPFQMPMTSMSPTIEGNRRGPDGIMVGGDHVVVERYAYWFNPPQRGDIIVFKTEGISEDQRVRYGVPSDEFYIKRIAGIPGDVLSIRDGHLCNHDNVLSGPSGLAKLEFAPLPGQPFLRTPDDIVKVPDDAYFTVGDNTTNSLDSRFYGTVSKKSIIGRISKIYWPPDRIGKVE